MKNVSRKSWFSLALDLKPQYNLDLIYSQFYHYMAGVTEQKDRFVFYFEHKNKKNYQQYFAQSFSRLCV